MKTIFIIALAGTLAYLSGLIAAMFNLRRKGALTHAERVLVTIADASLLVAMMLILVIALIKF